MTWEANGCNFSRRSRQGLQPAAIITSPLSPLAPMSDGSRAVGYMPSVQDAARSMGISASVVELRNPIEIEEKISGLKPHQGVVFPPNSLSRLTARALSSF